jgi:AcrR family transcriptional regulator
VLGPPNVSRLDKRRAAIRHEILDAAWAVAHEQGLAALTLRDVAARVDMRAPSLYSHFESKHAIYDAMFGQAWAECLETMQAATGRPPIGTTGRPVAARELLRHLARAFFDFAVSDLARYQLMNQRTVHGFVPTPAAYAPAIATIEVFRSALADLGVTREEDVDLATALIGGLADAQLANDPGGDRWSRLLDRAVDMYAAQLGLASTATDEDSP